MLPIPPIKGNQKQPLILPWKMPSQINEYTYYILPESSNKGLKCLSSSNQPKIDMDIWF